MPRPPQALAFGRGLLVTIVIASLVTACVSCRQPEPRPGDAPDHCGAGTVDIGGHRVRAKGYGLPVVGYDNLPQGLTRTVMPLGQLHEIEGLPLAEIQGRMGYHPVRTSCLLMTLLGSYLTTHDANYLEKALVVSDEFLATGVERDGALYFPYTFDFNLHGDDDELMKAPWYSGMAQGMALSAYVRLYQIAQDGRYLEACRKIFRSFTIFKGEENVPWIAYVDSAGFYWIEEYPIQPPANTLNGFVFAIFGLYEYHLLEGDPETKAVLQAAITTVESYMPQFRQKGNLSLYCLKHEVQSAKYHLIHIRQMRSLGLMTGDRVFNEMTRRLTLDTIVVLTTFRSGWTDTVMTLLPSRLSSMIRSLYQLYQRIRQPRVSSVDTLRAPLEGETAATAGT